MTWRGVRGVLLAGLMVAVQAWADGPAAPTVLKPDAVLPDRKVEADLGERRFSVKEEAAGAKEVLAFYAKDSQLISDPRLQQRVDEIGHKVVTAACRLGPRQIRLDGDGTEPLTFTFRVLDSKDINAFSAWGGNIFITKSMIDFCQSDDELAGIMAHETAHSMYHHLREQTARLRRYKTQQIFTMIAAAFMGINVAQAGIMAQYVYLALFNGHSVTDEAQADHAGCLYAYLAGYNPVGMITTFERLHRYQMSTPLPTDLGAFQTHPWSDERARSLEAEIRQLGLPVDRADVTQSLRAAIRLDPTQLGHAELYLDDARLFRVAAVGGQAAEERAAALALSANLGLSRGLRAGTLRLTADGDAYLLQGATRTGLATFLRLDPADAHLAGQTFEAFREDVLNRFLARCREAELENGSV